MLFRGVNRVGLREQLCLLERREAYRGAGQHLQIRGFQLVQQETVLHIAVAALEAHGQAEVVHLTHIILMRGKDIEPFEKELTGVRSLIELQLEGFALPGGSLVPRANS